jgi:lipoprotein signal peptidase
MNRTMMVFLAAWPLFYIVATLIGGVPSDAWIWTLLIPVVAAFVGWVVIKPAAERFEPSTPTLALLSAGLVLLDQGAKLLVHALLGWERSVLVIRDAFTLRISPNYHGSYIASLLNADVPPGLYLVVYPLVAWLTFSAMGFYESRNGRTGWLTLGRVFLAAGLMSATADRLFWGFTLDWLVVHGMFACDLKDLFVNLAVLSVLSDLVANSAFSFKLSYGLRDDLRLVADFGKYLVGRRENRQDRSVR